MSRATEISTELVAAAASDYLRAGTLLGARRSHGRDTAILIVTALVARPKTHYRTIEVRPTAPYRGRHGFPGQSVHVVGKSRVERQVATRKRDAAMTAAHVQWAQDVVTRAHAFAVAHDHLAICGVRSFTRWSDTETSAVDVSFADPRVTA